MGRAMVASMLAVAVAAGTKEIEVLYKVEPTWPHLEKMLNQAKSQYEAAHKGVTIKLTAVQGNNEVYYTKLALLNRSADSAPDVYLHDTFQVNADVAAGKLAPLDDYLATWPDWASQYADSVKQAAKGPDGKTTAFRSAPTPGGSGTARRSSPRPASRCRGSPRPGPTC